MTDVRIYNDGTLIGLEPVSDRALDWFARYVDSEPWQWLGPVLWVDHRAFAAISDALHGEGFTIE